MTLHVEGKTDGDSLGGGCYVGLMDGNVTNFNGCWELESDLPAMASVYQTLSRACCPLAGTPSPPHPFALLLLTRGKLECTDRAQ